jgi:hypothetical protein
VDVDTCYAFWGDRLLISTGIVACRKRNNCSVLFRYPLADLWWLNKSSMGSNICVTAFYTHNCYFQDWTDQLCFAPSFDRISLFRTFGKDVLGRRSLLILSCETTIGYLCLFGLIFLSIEKRQYKTLIGFTASILFATNACRDRARCADRQRPGNPVGLPRSGSCRRPCGEKRVQAAGFQQELRRLHRRLCRDQPRLSSGKGRASLNHGSVIITISRITPANRAFKRREIAWETSDCWVDRAEVLPMPGNAPPAPAP